MYRVTMQVSDLGWVDLVLRAPLAGGPMRLATYCPSRMRGHAKYESTQPRSETCMVILYLCHLYVRFYLKVSSSCIPFPFVYHPSASLFSRPKAAGEHGMRHSLPNARIMIHQPSGGARGQATDIQIQAEEIIKLKRQLNQVASRAP